MFVAACRFLRRFTEKTCGNPKGLAAVSARFFHPQVFSSRIGAAGTVEARVPLRLFFYLGFEMTKTEAKAFLEQLGVKVGEITDDVAAKVEAAKAQLDTETRRKVRAFWVCVAALGVFVGIGIGVLI